MKVTMKSLILALVVFSFTIQNTYSEEKNQSGDSQKCVIELSDKRVAPRPQFVKLLSEKGYEIKVKQNDTVQNLSANLNKWISFSRLSEKEVESLEDKFLLLSISDFEPMCRKESLSVSLFSANANRTTFNCSLMPIKFNTVQDKKLVNLLPIGKGYRNEKKFSTEEEAFADILTKMAADLPACATIRSANNMKKSLEVLAVKDVDPNQAIVADHKVEVNDNSTVKVVAHDEAVVVAQPEANVATK